MITESNLFVPPTDKTTEQTSLQNHTAEDFDAEQEAELERMAERMIMESNML